MHERGLVTRAASEFLQSIGEQPVTTVVLSVGPDTDRAVVEEAWRSATVGTEIASARLELADARHELVCLDCTRPYRGGKLSTCPQCGGNGLVVERVPDVEVTRWESEEPL